MGTRYERTIQLTAVSFVLRRNSMMKFKKKTVYINENVPFRTLWKEPKLQWDVIGIALGITVLLMFGAWYLTLPALNLKNAGFWVFAMAAVLIYFFAKMIVSAIRKKDAGVRNPVIVFTVLIVGLFGNLIFSSRLFHAKAYSEILKVEDAEIDLIPSVSGSSSIALMDTASAERLGDRKIGSLSNVVSQFNVGEYMQINYQEAPVKVAALKYDGFFKWNANKNQGIPGYVIVNPVDMSADYASLKEGMRFVPSAYFSKNLYRHIRFNNPSLLVDNVHFEIDEEGNPWYVGSIYDHTIGLFGGKKVTGALIINPVNGDMQKYALSDVPVWADIVIDGDLICTQYNDHAQLQHGFWNSVFSQTDCRQVTTIRSANEDGDEEAYPDYGYIAKEGDIWVYTGVTSLNGDSSNLGFILANERTAETKYITCAGADEFSGMKSAEGEVQEKGYIASFPSLINVEGTPTYIMVLKDSNGLVKMYAAVNVEQYNIVATAATQADCIEKYRKLMNAEITPDEAKSDEPAKDTSNYTEMTVKVKKLQTIDKGGDTYIYVVDETDHIYNAKYADVIGMILVEEGDEITILTDGTDFLLKE